MSTGYFTIEGDHTGIGGTWKSGGLIQGIGGGGSGASGGGGGGVMNGEL
jgi:hypothetical protein